MALLHLSSVSLSSVHSRPRPKTNPTHCLRPLAPIKSCANSNATPPYNCTTLSSLDSVKPYVQSQWRPILAGWACSAASVYSLSLMVPKVGRFSAVMGAATDTIRLREEALVLGALAMARIVTTYWQQAFLWDAALKAVYEIRIFVFERVLQRDLAFFEGGSGASPGDIAYRITAEASDVADTLYALLNTIVPSILQLSAMASQMLVISPFLSFVSALLIPTIAYATAYLGQELRRISKNTNIRIAALSAYLNELIIRSSLRVPDFSC